MYGTENVFLNICVELFCFYIYDNSFSRSRCTWIYLFQFTKKGSRVCVADLVSFCSFVLLNCVHRHKCYKLCLILYRVCLLNYYNGNFAQLCFVFWLFVKLVSLFDQIWCDVV